MTIYECINESEKLEDSLELSKKLLEIADNKTTDEPAAYYIKEAATNLVAQFELIRSLLGRLNSTGQATTIQKPPPDTYRKSSGPDRAPSGVYAPAHAAAAGTDLMDLADVLAMTRIGRTAWLERVKKGIAPSPVRIGKSSRWRRSDVQRWCDELK